MPKSDYTPYLIKGLPFIKHCKIKNSIGPFCVYFLLKKNAKSISADVHK